MELKTPLTEFIDAQEMKQKNPDTFEAPAAEEIDAVEVGGHIKACPDGERFWLQVEEIGEGRGFEREFIARVDNELLCSDEHGLELNDRVKVLGRQIYSIYG